ncbi:MAG TPA: hypothetical protein EYG85_06280 [Crocinitomix sp.]|nr:hypothetical protein [Crocinitomix sp.]
MKKLLGLVLGMFLTVSVFANGVVTYTSAESAEKSKTEGVFSFSFNSEFSKEEITKAAKYYTSYFTVAVNSSIQGVDVTIKLVDDNEMARRVITRFFVTLEVKEIVVNGKSIMLEDFISTYVMK